ncbi:MAG TPA: phosphoribosylanthranilate isomerase [Pseudomonadales bacterium]|jgi:phosphoribosylanthranilate isomerase|nr:phosphoribosylanthranilate isomerase [Pseudomonadales bacterium]
MRVRAKICGITRLADAQAAIAAGCDALGFNFHESSPRYISPAKARAIIEVVPPFVSCVGLFVDATSDEVRRSAEAAGVGLLQFHGDETDADCAGVGYPFIKVIRVTGPIDATALARRYPRATALLFDSGTATKPGGTGMTFDWSWWPGASSMPLILAGGLTPDNVAEGIRRTRPYAVDVSSGVESSTKGEKDVQKLQQFMTEVQRARGN